MTQKNARWKLALNWLLNSGLFYFGWIYMINCVVQHSIWKGVLVCLLIIGIDIWRSSNRLFEAALLASFPILGSLFDTALAYVGILAYEETYFIYPWLAPLWVTALWALFATSLNQSLAWVGRTWWLAAFFGAVGGTISYYAVIRAGAAHFLVPEVRGILYLALSWAVIMPLCYVYSNWLKQRFGLS